MKFLTKTGFPTKLYLLTLALALLSGCAVIFPSHPNSGDHEGETVEVQKETLTTDKIECVWNKQEWNEIILEADCKNPSQQKGLVAPFLGAAAGVVVGLAIDAVANAIEKEGGEHEAYFGRRYLFKDYWKKPQKNQEAKGAKKTTSDGIKIITNSTTDTREAVCKDMSCIGTPSFNTLRLIRTTNKYPDKNNPAFELILYFEPQSDKDEFLVYPLRYINRSAKAKVLDAWCSPVAYEDILDNLGCAVGYVPPLIFVKFFQDSKSNIQSSAVVKMDARWKTPDQKVHTDTINNILFAVKDYSMDNVENGSKKEPNMVVYCENSEASTDFNCSYKKGSKPKFGEPLSWAGAIPVSQDSEDTIINDGTYALEIKVGEIDLARVEKMTKPISNFLTDNKEKITSEIVKRVTGEKK